MRRKRIYTIPERQGKAAIVNKGQSVRVINTHGQQVVDAWVFNLHDVTEFQSNEHTRATLVKLMFSPGDCLYSNRRRPMLKVEKDTSGGVHDLLMAACDTHRYEMLGCTEYHENCTDNLRQAMTDIGYEAPDVPSPINIFMNIPWSDDGELKWMPPVCSPGDYIQFQANMDCIFVFSACPQDLLPVNGEGGQPTEAHYQIL